MSNRLYEHKRSSLELSESDSDDYDYRGQSSAQKDEYTESYGHPYSPESNYFETSGKPNPKSILKEGVSASKAKRNIIINETLNETHRIAQKNGSNNTSPDKHSLDESDKRYRDYIRDDRLGSGTSGTFGQSAEKEDYTDEDDEYGSKLTSKYSQDEYDRPHSGFKNRLVVGQGLTEFQKAHAKKLDQEREQTYSSKGVSESAAQVREKWLSEKEKKGLDTDELDASQGTNQLNTEEEYRRKNRGYEGYSDKKDTYGSRHSDPASKFERMEDKISFVEKELDNYSRALMRNTMTQKEKTENLNRVCEDFEHRLQDLKEDIDQSLYGKKKITDFEAEIADDIRAESNKNGVSSKSLKSKKGTTGGKKKSSTFKKLQEEIEKLKDENGLLKERVVEKQQRDKERTIKGKEILDTDLLREKEIIDTIERIKKKLRKAITKKLHKERENEIARTMDETTQKSLGKNYTSYGLHYKDVLKRKAIEEKTSTKENAYLLHKGLPVTYKDYESPLFAEKLTKTVKK